VDKSIFRLGLDWLTDTLKHGLPFRGYIRLQPELLMPMYSRKVLSNLYCWVGNSRKDLFAQLEEKINLDFFWARAIPKRVKQQGYENE
jgi:hypothetical protein